MYKYLLFLREAISIIKLEANDPKKKKRMYRKYTVPFQNRKLNTSSIKNAKWPVTFVVRVWTDKYPATFTIPATKDSKQAIRRLW